MADVAYCITPYTTKTSHSDGGFCDCHRVTGSLAAWSHTVTPVSSKYGAYWSDHPSALSKIKNQSYRSILQIVGFNSSRRPVVPPVV